MRIIVLDGRTLAADDNPWTALHELGEVELYERSTPDEVRERAPRAHVLIVNKARVPGEVIDSCPELRFIAVSATGHDCVDGAAARRRGIPVGNVPVYGTNSVAQFTFALLLELCHHVGRHAAAVQAGIWCQSPEFSFWLTPQVELEGKTLGVIGQGRIGQRVADLARAFGMQVLSCGRAGSALDLAPQVDVLSLHCPLTPATAGLVNRALLVRMKPSALLLNTARGGLVVEVDLAEALNTGRLAGAAVDVVSQEPIRADNPLLTARNCLITPHIAWTTQAARQRLLAATVANVRAFLKGRPANVVNGVGGLA